VTDANSALLAELVASGLERREARWLMEEFFIGEDIDARRAVRAAAERRLAGEPLQYVLGHWPFRGLDLDVDPRVLIPRPETEELVSVALAQLAARDLASPLIVDLGCGSGAIGLALLDELARRGVRANVIALDVSRDALDVARRNALKHGLHHVSFVLSSWFDELDASLRGRVDLVVANPPYVGAREYPNLERVLDYEPRGALVARDDQGVEGFFDVGRIVQEAPAWLSPEGVLVCEHGENHGDAAQRAARDAGFGDVRDVKDLAGKDRILVATK